MKLKSVIKYNISSIKTSVLIFYLVMFAVIILMSSSITIKSSGDGNSYSGGAEMASLIFLFVIGLNSFKEDFLFLSVNNIPRKLQFKAFLITALSVCFIMAAIDTAYSSILSQFFTYKSGFIQIYEKWTVQTSTPLVIISIFIWSVVLYLAAYLVGYFITNLYYHMNKTAKIIFSIGIPVWFVILLPIIDSSITKGKITNFIGYVFRYLGGLQNIVNPYIAVLSLLLVSVATAGLSFLMVRKAVVKN